MSICIINPLYRGNCLHCHCNKQTIYTVKSTMLQAPQMATIVEKTNNKLTITFMMTAFLFANAKTMQIWPVAICSV